MNKTVKSALGLLAAFTLAGTLASTLVGVASAADTDPGIYGQIDTGRFPHPKVINKRPVTGDHKVHGKTGSVIYLHVRPGEEWHWYAHCAGYQACSTPVYFVTENWFVNVYLPAIGSHDGREQTYLTEARRERALARDKHDREEKEE